MDEKIKELYEKKLITVEQARELKYASPEEREVIVRRFFDNQEVDDDVVKQLKSSFTDSLDLDVAPGAQDVLTTPEMAPEQANIEPLFLAQELSKETGMPLEQAQQEVAQFPRRTMSFLGGEESHILPTIGDIGSAPGRLLSGALLGDEPVIESMGRVDPTPFTQSGEERGFFPMLAESVLRDPTLPTTPLTGGAGLKIASKIPALMTGTRGANIGRAAVGGGLASLGETFLEQQTRPSQLPQLELGDYATIGALGGGLGGLAGGLTKPRVAPTATPRQQQREFLKETKGIEEAGKLKGVDVENINPLYRQDFFSELTNLDVPYKEYAKVAKQKMSPGLEPGAPRAKSSLEFAVDKVAAPAFEKYKAETAKVGEKIGEVREKLLPEVQPISKDEFVQRVSEAMGDEVVRLEREVIDGQEFIRPINKINGKVLPLDSDTKKIVDALGKLDESVDGGDLRFFQNKINKLIPVDPVSSQRIISPETRSLIGIEKMSRDAIDEGIEGVAGKDVAQYFRTLRSKYGPMRSNVEELGRQLGKTINFTPNDAIKETTQKGFKKGEGAIARILQSKQSQGAKFLWDDVKNVTGYNVPKAAAYALQAGEEAGDATTRSLLDQMGQIQKQLPKDMQGRSMFEAGAGLGKKALQVGKEIVRPSQGRGVLAAAQSAAPTMQAPQSFVSLGDFLGRGLIDQPLAEEVIFPYIDEER